MSKIDFNSRYYDDFQKLKAKIDYGILFEAGYNDDKNYPYKIYSKLIKPVKEYQKVIDEFYNYAIDFLDKELYRDNEKNLLVENLLLYLKNYGHEAIYNLGRGEHEIARKILESRGFKTWNGFTLESIIENINMFPDKITDIIKYILAIKSGLIIRFTDYSENFLGEKKAISFINHFDKVNSRKVYNYFKETLADKKYITIEELLNFLKQAFENKVAPNNKFNLQNYNTKKDIYKIFYLYYKEIAGKPYGKQKDYAGLLGEYFEGFNTTTVSTNFNKVY